VANIHAVTPILISQIQFALLFFPKNTCAVTVSRKHNSAQNCYVQFLCVFLLCPFSLSQRDPTFLITIVISSEVPEFPWKKTF